MCWRDVLASVRAAKVADVRLSKFIVTSTTVLPLASSIDTAEAAGNTDRNLPAKVSTFNAATSSDKTNWVRTTSRRFVGGAGGRCGGSGVCGDGGGIVGGDAGYGGRGTGEGGGLGRGDGGGCGGDNGGRAGLGGGEGNGDGTNGDGGGGGGVGESDGGGGEGEAGGGGGMRRRKAPTSASER